VGVIRYMLFEMQYMLQDMRRYHVPIEFNEMIWHIIIHTAYGPAAVSREAMEYPLD
jgi:hypothetical protein